MDIKQLQEEAKKQQEILLKRFNVQNKEELTYPHVLKLMEETGELAQAVLHTKSLQRKDKLEKNNEDVGLELADIISCCFIIAENMNLDLNEKIKENIEKINSRE